MSEIVNNITEMTLEEINEGTNDFVSGTLVSLIGGSTGKALGQIKEGIEKTQDMILELQASLDEFREETGESLREIQSELELQDLGDRTEELDDYYTNLKTLEEKYSGIIWPTIVK